MHPSTRCTGRGCPSRRSRPPSWSACWQPAASPKRSFTAARETVDDAWKLATDADRALPELGLQTSLVDRMCNRYLGRFVAAAEQDQVLARVFYDVTGMLVSPSRLLAPSLIPRVLWG